MPDIFISYRRSDCQSEAFALHQALLLHFSPEQVFLDTSRIEPGAVWSDRLTAAVQESKVMLVLIGPKWLKAQDEESGTRRLDDPEDWVRREVGTGLSSETLVIPLLFNKAAMPKAAYLPPPLQELPDRQYRELRAGEWPSDLAWVLETIGQRVERRAENNTATSPSIRNRQLTPPPPAPPPHFTGREADLTALHESLAGPGKSCLLLTCGTGGIGKTTLATAYYSQYGDQYRHCAWVECPTENALNGLVDSALGTLFKSPDAGRDFPSDRLQRFRQEGPEPIRSEESPQKRFQRIRQGLAGLEGPNLLIIDNANDPESIREIYPELVLPNWSVLVTTRAELPEFPHRNVYSLPKDEARNYFCSLYAPAVREPELLDELLERTGCHTLTLEVLAKTLATQPGYSFPKLMEDLRRRGLPGIIRSTTAAIGWRNRKVAKTSTPAELLRIVFDVARLSGAERDLLTAWAILPSVHISYEQLRAIMPVRENYRFWKITVPDRWIGWLRRIAWLPGFAVPWTAAEFDALVNSLTSKGWLEFEAEEKSWKLHQVIRELILGRRKWMPYDRFWGEMANNMARILQKMNETKASVWLPYGQAMVEYLLPKYSSAVWMTGAVSDKYMYRGNPKLALGFRMQLLQKKILYLDLHNLDVNYSRLGDLFSESHNIDQAYIFYKKSMRISKIRCLLNPFSKENRRSLTISYDKIGNILMDRGKMEEAEKFYKKSHRILSSNPTSKNFKADLAVSFSNLGDISFEQENLVEARMYFEKSLAISQELLFADPESEWRKQRIHNSFIDIAAIYIAEGKPEEAEVYYEKSLEIAQQLTTLNPASERLQRALARAYIQLGNLSWKIQKREKAITCYKKNLKLLQTQADVYQGSDWWQEELAKGANLLGFSYLVAGEPSLAKPLIEQAVGLGLVWCNMNIGHLKLINKDEPGAVELYQMSLENYTDKNIFWEGMETDFQYLTQYGITRPQYDAILEKLRAASE